MTTLSAEVIGFLNGLNCASVATLDPDGSPRQAVVWYRLEADGRILINSRTPRRWCTNLMRNRHVALSVIDGANGYSFVGLTGVVDEIVDDVEQAREDIVGLANRYHRGNPPAATIAAFRQQPRVTLRIRITGVHDHLKG